MRMVRVFVQSKTWLRYSNIIKKVSCSVNFVRLFLNLLCKQCCLIITVSLIIFLICYLFGKDVFQIFSKTLFLTSFLILSYFFNQLRIMFLRNLVLHIYFILLWSKPNFIPLFRFEWLLFLCLEILNLR